MDGKDRLVSPNSLVKTALVKATISQVKVKKIKLLAIATMIEDW